MHKHGPMAAHVLVLIGALNWGLVGLFEFNLVTAVFGTSTQLVQAVYALIGLSALYVFFNFRTLRK